MGMAGNLAPEDGRGLPLRGPGPHDPRRPWFHTAAPRRGLRGLDEGDRGAGRHTDEGGAVKLPMRHQLRFPLLSPGGGVARRMVASCPRASSPSV